MKPNLRRSRPVERLVEFAPSVSWIVLMILPVVYQNSSFHVTGRQTQLLVVFAIGLFMLGADYLSCRVARNRTRAVDESVPPLLQLLLGLCFIVPVTIHLLMMPRVPLLALLTTSGDPGHTLLQLRHESAKFLDVPAMVKYLFNWALFVFAPLHIAVSWFLGRKMLALSGFVVAVVYSSATLAKLPLVMLVLACLFAFCVLPSRQQKYLTMALAATVIGGLLLVGVTLASGSMETSDANQSQPAAMTQMRADDPRRALTLGDHLRLATHGDDRAGIEKALAYAVYRVWLTPSDVSNRWYQYFSYGAGETLGFQFLTPGSRTVPTDSPSRMVGIWAYQARFPDKYADTVNAYASFDADAFAHGGVWAVALATAILLACRVGCAWLLTPHPVALASYGVLLCMLTILPSSASLQAIFGANGLAVIPALILFLYLTQSGYVRDGNRRQLRS